MHALSLPFVIAVAFKQQINKFHKPLNPSILKILIHTLCGRRHAEARSIFKRCGIICGILRNLRAIIITCCYRYAKTPTRAKGQNQPEAYQYNH